MPESSIDDLTDITLMPAENFDALLASLDVAEDVAALGRLGSGGGQRFTHIKVPDDVDSVALLLKVREDER